MKYIVVSLRSTNSLFYSLTYLLNPLRIYTNTNCFNHVSSEARYFFIKYDRRESLQRLFLIDKRHLFLRFITSFIIIFYSLLYASKIYAEKIFCGKKTKLCLKLLSSTGTTQPHVKRNLNPFSYFYNTTESSVASSK